MLYKGYKIVCELDYERLTGAAWASKSESDKHFQKSFRVSDCERHVEITPPHDVLSYEMCKNIQGIKSDIDYYIKEEEPRFKIERLENLYSKMFKRLGELEDRISDTEIHIQDIRNAIVKLLKE